MRTAEKGADITWGESFETSEEYQRPGGEIVNIDKKDKYLTVRFAVGEKKFVNPDGFTKGFLKFKE